jgi:two-component system, sensor histidine kinase and response regulator
MTRSTTNPPSTGDAMTNATMRQSNPLALVQRMSQLIAEQQNRLFRQTDQLFAGLLVFEFLAGLLAALWIAPYTWSGTERQLHPHLWAAGVLGLTFISLPVYLACRYPGGCVTRHTIAAAQMAMSALLIHLTGGRIETHFHVFGSLAFLAFYRDWRVLVTASAVTAADHLLRGMIWPQSIYGIEAASSWRWIEHAGWVIFEDVFLVLSCLRSNRETRTLAERQASLEATNEMIELRTVELKLSQQALESANGKLAGVLDAATQVSIIATDVAGIITVFNTGAEQMLGYAAGEMVGRHTPEIILRPDEIADRAEELSCEFGRAITGFDVLVANVCRQKHERREWTFVRKDGSQFAVNLVITAVKNAAGEVTGYLGVAEDITIRKETERQLVTAREKAEQAARAKSEFLANMSHEIRTPMNGIIGMTELALGTSLTLDQREYLETVKSSADSLLRIINDILDFSKIEAGKLELDPHPFRLRDSLGDTMKTLAVRADEKHLELVWHVPSEVPDGFLGDVGRLRQVLVNLVGNAIKFTSKGEVGVTVELESRSDSHARLHFAVHDTGMGIPIEKQALVFETFSQADTSTTRLHGGTGLGLSISRQIVQLMGGEIAVQSEPGQGSTFDFTIELPFAGDCERDEAPVDLEGVPVLVVDDNDTNRRILDGMLRGWKMLPTLTASGAAALDAMLRAEAEGHPFPLVLTDCHMPSMDGFMFVEELKRHPELFGATIMMLTSGVPQEAFERCRQLGISATLLKPIKQSELQRAVAATLGKTSHIPPSLVPTNAPAIAPTGSRLRVLLAEDNLVNQRVAMRFVEKLGHEIHVVGNGQLALDALKTTPFDVVLMDIQMPVLDGVKATVALRQREQSTGRHTPVIAMTAHAMSGDRDRCLAKGMDDYLSKPIQVTLLAAALARVTAESRGATERGEPEPTGSASSPPTERVCDLKAALEGVDGEGDFLKELTEVFLATTPDMLAELKRAVELADADEVNHLAHALKGSVSNFSAHPSFSAALQLERISLEGDLQGSEAAYNDLLREIEKLSEVLRTEVLQRPLTAN